MSSKPFGAEAGVVQRTLFPALRLAVMILLAGSPSLYGGEGERKAIVVDYDAPCFAGEKALILDTTQPAEIRSSRISYLVQCGPREAAPVLASVLDDPAEAVRRRAGQFLALLGDERGLRAQESCISNSACGSEREVAIRLLGARGNQKSAPLIVHEIENILSHADWEEGRWQVDPSTTTFLTAGVISLARLGRHDDSALILRIVETAPDLRFDQRLLEALGCVDDPRARSVLWDVRRLLVRRPSCFERSLGVSALVALSRLGDPKAIDELRLVIRGIGTPTNCKYRASDPEALSVDRAEAFKSLKPRDAANFAETVFEVAAQEPEDLGTREAWIALGIMRPTGFGAKLFKLAMTKKPHWRLVQRQTLHDVIMATDPTLNEEFWREYSVEAIPAHTAQKELVSMHLGRLMFSGGDYWMGWTGD